VLLLLLLLHNEVAAGEVAVRNASVVQERHAAAHGARERLQQRAVRRLALRRTLREMRSEIEISEMVHNAQ
jgi:hypothetical protein